jgi:hypothetical protein
VQRSRHYLYLTLFLLHFGCRLRSTNLREELLSKGTTSPRQKKKAQPEWIRQIRLRPTRRGHQVRRHVTHRSSSKDDVTMDLMFDHKMRLRPTREGELLSRGQSIRTLPSTTMDVVSAHDKRPSSAKKTPRRGLLRIGSSDSISHDGSRLLLPSAVVRKQRRGKRRVRESSAGIVHPQEQTSPTKVIESDSPTSLTTSMTDESTGINATPMIPLSLDEPPPTTGRGIRLKRRGLVRTYSSDLGHRDDRTSSAAAPPGAKRASQPAARESVTLQRQGSVQVGLGDETLMLNVVKVQVNQPTAPPPGHRRGGLRTTPKGARLARGESIRTPKRQ